ncbi:hypothetical protein K1T71_011326 [Dendrolimus kikuchii]|uniref:Uncharacterized protein n=1 Tax=Dendrolimus kikuchii TaxID=765133 RepID=A0ACC1CNF7_9NEOP|nr:hypothetical protein K1T71_011326 [Dendrolimus kikuchii]
MESLPNTPLLEFPPNTLMDVRKLFGLGKPGEMADAVNILYQWVQQQNHFMKKDFSKEYLERTIIMCKGSIEKAKKRLDKLCTMKTFVSKYFTYSNINEELTTLLSSGWFTILPKLTKDFYRVILIKSRNTNYTASQFVELLYIFVIVVEYINAHDYCAGFILLFDYRDVNVVEAISKIDLHEVQQFIPIMMEGYSARVKSIAWITDSKLIQGFIKALKSLLSEKIGKRVHVFDLESVCNLCEKDILPMEYGGKEKSIEELYDNLLKVLSSKEHVEYVKEMHKAKTDETKRAVHVFNEQYMGIAGTFRRLNVD